MRRRYPIIAITAGLLLLLIALPASADDLDSAVTSARGSSLPTLPAAESVAEASARAQASAGKPFHTDLSSLLSVCDSVGEVVGMGPNVAMIFDEFASSSWHRSVISAPKWASIGTGQTRGADGYLYISVVFCEQGAALAPPPSAPPPTVAAPAPPIPIPTSAATTRSIASSKITPFDRELCPLITGEDLHDDLGASFCII